MKNRIVLHQSFKREGREGREMGAILAEDEKYGAEIRGPIETAKVAF